ncbi:MAG: hypothetical protein N3J91_05900 [Verrucomicrobiae bacterium]|nr:hypothetical protein [Verrucomicrobiae bacterium]
MTPNPPDGCLYDDQGHLVPVVAFEYPQDAAEAAEAEEARARQEVVIRLLQYLVDGAEKNPRRVGQRVLLLCYMLGVLPYKSAAALARSLGLSRQRVSVLLTKIQRKTL